MLWGKAIEEASPLNVLSEPTMQLARDKIKSSENVSRLPLAGDLLQTCSLASVYVK